MRRTGLQAKAPRRFVATTDSGHDEPIFPNLARDFLPTGPDQRWVADITYLQLPTRFACLAAILDAWSRKVVGYAIPTRSKRSSRWLRWTAPAVTATPAPV
jgi:putative transposase